MVSSEHCTAGREKESEGASEGAREREREREKERERERERWSGGERGMRPGLLLPR